MYGSRVRAILLAGVALAAHATPALAQNSSDSGAPSYSEGSNDIIVTARRKEEALQDVPQTINALSSDTLQKLRINNASDIAQIVPGLSIEGGSSGSGGFGASSGIRGVPTFLNSNATPIVQFYLNDASTGNGPDVTQSLFDIGQVEVLKGPQGTLRGRSAPSGAITITTRRPDLDQVGGTVLLSGTDKSNINLQAAVGLPLIQDVLGLRVAGLIDNNDGNGVTSANAGHEPYVRTKALRGTLLFQPSPDFTASIMFQRMWRKNSSYLQVFGPGNGLVTQPANGPGLNGPAIAPGDRLGITDGANQTDARLDMLVGQFDWTFAGQKLSYVGSYRKGRSDGHSPQDVANVLPGLEYYQYTQTPTEAFSHELRLSSDERIAGIFDYTIGAFYSKEKSQPTVNGVAQFLNGAFGRPIGNTASAALVQAPLDRYTLHTNIAIDPVSTEASAFGTLTAHLGESTELSAGGRFIRIKRHDAYTLALQGAFNGIPNPTGGFRTCEQIGLTSSPVYTGVCDVSIASSTLQSVDRRSKFTPFIYNLSASHKFTPNFMVYATMGTAFRSAGPSIGITSLTTCCTAIGGDDLGTLEDLTFPSPEKSKTYEIGFKSTFLDNRARLNVALFQQKFKNFFFLTQSTRYLGVTTTQAAGQVGSFEFTANADAKVKGIDIEAGFQVTPRWNVDLGFSWSKAKLDNALIPCNDGNFDGVVDNIVPTAANFIAAGVLVARCRSSEAISRTPRWNLTVQSEYAAPISSAVDGFVRGNYVYYPDNPNSSQGVVIDKYSLLNMYAGIRDPENGWEVSLFANNLLNTKQVLSVNPVAPVSSGNTGAIFGRPNVGYQQISYTPRREFGLLVRYSFGSR